MTLPHNIDFIPHGWTNPPAFAAHRDGECKLFSYGNDMADFETDAEAFAAAREWADRKEAA